MIYGMTVEQKREIKRAFREYPKHRAEIASRIADIAEKGLSMNLDSLNTGNASSCVESGVVSLSGEYTYKWCLVVESTVKYFQGTEIADLIDLYFFRRSSEFKICDTLHIERTAVYRKIEQVLNLAHKYAIQHGVLCV